MRTTSGTSGTMWNAQHSNHRSPRKRRQKERPWEATWGDNSWKFPKMRKEIVTQVQETQRVPNRINPRQNMPRQTVIKLTKIKTQRTNIKSSKRKTTNNSQGDPHKDTSWSFNRNSSSQKGMAGHTLKWLKRKTHNPDYCTQQGSHSDIKENSKALQTSKSSENSAPPNQLSNKC